MPMRIDSHQHYWSIARGDYGWLTPETGVLYRDYLPEDLESSLAACGIDGTIVVQAAQTLEETEYLLALADRTPSILGVVGWLDLRDSAWREHQERFGRHAKYVGFRVMIQEMADSAEVLTEPYVEALKTCAELDIPVDLLVRSHQLGDLVALLERVPGLRGVVDHLAKPPIASGVLDPWAGQMAAIAAHPKIACKLSGMVTEAKPYRWTPADFAGYVGRVLEAFGPNRVMFGSDWPVCLLGAGSYAQVVELLDGLLTERGLGADERDAIYGGNAARFYKLRV